MYIVITMPNRTFYFTEANLRNLLNEENPNGIVNMVLANYYATKARVGANGIAMNAEKKKKFEELKSKFPSVGEQTVVPAEESA